MLNFNNRGFSTNCREIVSLTPAYSPIWDATQKDQAHTTQDPYETFVTPNKKDPGNFINNNTSTTNSVDVDAGMSPIMAKELQ